VKNFADWWHENAFMITMWLLVVVLALGGFGL